MSLEITTLSPDRICENRNVGDNVGTITAIDGVEPFIFAILNPEFSTYVELVNSENSNFANLILKRQFDREVKIFLFFNLYFIYTIS